MSGLSAEAGNNLVKAQSAVCKKIQEFGNDN
jgi:hypothetical protein